MNNDELVAFNPILANAVKEAESSAGNGWDLRTSRCRTRQDIRAH